jgi:predicted kinase
MKYQLDDIAEIASKLTALDLGTKKDLILITALPGVGKTTLAKEFAKQTQGIHFDLDEIKRVVVPADEVTEGIDPPACRYKYYAGAIRMLPDLFAKSSTRIVIMDETFHLQVFRQMWDEAAQKLKIKIHWVAAVCDEAIVKERLKIGKNRKNHILGDKGHQMYLIFKKAFEPLEQPHEMVDTSKDIAPQVQRILKKRSIL